MLSSSNFLLLLLVACLIVQAVISHSQFIFITFLLSSLWSQHLQTRFFHFSAFRLHYLLWPPVTLHFLLKSRYHYYEHSRLWVPLVRPYELFRGFSYNSILEDASKICRYILQFWLKLEGKKRTLYIKIYIRFSTYLIRYVFIIIKIIIIICKIAICEPQPSLENSADLISFTRLWITQQ